MPGSIRPSTFTQGGIFDPQVMTFRNPRWVIYDYGQPGGPTTFAFAIDLIEKSGAIHHQYLSAGDPAAFQPNEDGSDFVTIGDRKALADGSNFALFMKKMIEDGGYDEDFMVDEQGNDLPIKDIFDGLMAYMDWVELPTRTGLKNQTARTDGRKPTIPAVTRPIEEGCFPWQEGEAGSPARYVGNAQPGGASGPVTQTRRGGAASRGAGSAGSVSATTSTPAATAAPSATTETSPARGRGRAAASGQPAAPAFDPSAIVAETVAWLKTQLEGEDEGSLGMPVVMQRAFQDYMGNPNQQNVTTLLANATDLAAKSDGAFTYDGTQFVLAGD